MHNNSMKIKSLFLTRAILAAALLVGASPMAFAQLKIGVVNVPQLIDESPQAKTVTQALEGEFAGRQKAIVNQQNELKAREEKLQRDAVTMSETERNRIEKELRDGQRDLARRQNEFVEDLNVRRNEELGRLQRILLQEVQNYAKAQGYDLIVGDGVLFAKDALNVTSAVLSAMQTRGATPAAKPAAEPKKP